ncbi:MAG TPA: helix-hairpin-helix domain-containing protein [Thermoanaerobaculia bacterium]|jgi:competence protein ComEA|nr:helix-hairpin-helix domain-containing protein [Thermoanaerobaculia bacterium]
MPRHELEQSELVNLNNASLEDLARVPGIGRERAETLLMYREQNGPLANWGELRDVPGFEDEDLVEYVRGFAELS